MKYYDISPTISESLAVWPGDVAFSRKIAASIDQGSNIDLSSIHTTVHLGAHADSRSHYKKGGAPITEVDLTAYIGPCEVIEVNLPPSSRIQPKHLKAPVRAPRVLFKTNSYPDPHHFNTDFVSFSAELITELKKQNCILVGIDTPSVDPFDDKVLETHQELARTEMLNLEGLDLKLVPAGLYFLIAPPLKIQGADASPVRALLLPTFKESPWR